MIRANWHERTRNLRARLEFYNVAFTRPMGWGGTLRVGAIARRRGSTHLVGLYGLKEC
jgi:hypothetical protein